MMERLRTFRFGRSSRNWGNSPARPLRMEVYAAARLHWTADDWATVEDTEMSDAGLGVYMHEFGRGNSIMRTTLKFTFYWHQGHDGKAATSVW